MRIIRDAFVKSEFDPIGVDTEFENERKKKSNGNLKVDNYLTSKNTTGMKMRQLYRKQGKKNHRLLYITQRRSDQ